MSIDPNMTPRTVSNMYNQAVDNVSNQLTSQEYTTDEKFSALAMVIKVGTEVVQYNTEVAENALGRCETLQGKVQKLEKENLKRTTWVLEQKTKEAINKKNRYKRDIVLCGLGCAVSLPVLLPFFPFMFAGINAHTQMTYYAKECRIYENFPTTALEDSVWERAMRIENDYEKKISVAGGPDYDPEIQGEAGAEQRARLRYDCRQAKIFYNMDMEALKNSVREEYGRL